MQNLTLIMFLKKVADVLLCQRWSANIIVVLTITKTHIFMQIKRKMFQSPPPKKKKEKKEEKIGKVTLNILFNKWGHEHYFCIVKTCIQICLFLCKSASLKFLINFYFTAK